VIQLDVIALRREFHRYPELGFREFRTAGRVVEILTSLGYAVQWGFEVMEESTRQDVPADAEIDAAYQEAAGAGVPAHVLEKMRRGLTGVVAVLRGKREGPVLAFRFDMDALPVEESRDADHLPAREEFRSQIAGRMHACAHDGHTAIGLALAHHLAGGDFAGTLKLIFQPAEEGVCGGALSLIEKGVADDVDRMFCLHLMANMQVGEVYASTRYLASAKMIAEFFGTPAHAGGAPQKGNNALLGAASALLAMHALPPYPGQETRVNVGTLTAGTAQNIIPAYALMSLETRAKSREVNDDLVRRVEQIMQGSAQMYGLRYAMRTTGEATTYEADPALVELVQEEAHLAGFKDIHACYDSSVSEDGPFFIRHVQQRGGQGSFISVGTGMEEAHHTTRFDICEEVLPLAVELLRRLAVRILR
jgi:aminobenzoyl-glutamate utilization protein A